MKKYMFVAILVLSVMGTTAWAQQEPGQGQGGRNGTGKTFAPENFQEMKTRVLQMLEERKTRLDQEKACVEKAGTMEDLRKCRPEPQMGRGGMGGQGGPREQRSPGSPPAERK